jgi:hypothetical protein
MTKFTKRLLLAAILGLMFILGYQLDAADKKALTDKQRITQLELQVSTIQEDLAGEHQWAMSVNDALNTLDDHTNQLNQRLQKVESRGPVARLNR